MIFHHLHGIYLRSVSSGNFLKDLSIPFYDPSFNHSLLIDKNPYRLMFEIVGRLPCSIKVVVFPSNPIIKQKVHIHKYSARKLKVLENK